MPCFLVGQGHLLDAVVLQLAGSRHWQFINKSIEPRALLSGDSVGTDESTFGCELRASSIIGG